MDQAVPESLPTTSGEDSVILGSPILEVTFVENVGGAVSVVPVAGLVDPIILRISPADPSVGDACGYFDTNVWAWSSEGTQLLTAEELSAAGFADVTGTWCAVSHLTAFAIVQRVPFELLHDTAVDVLGSSYVTSVAIASGVAGCALLACCFVCMQLRAPTKGSATLADKKGTTNVSFTCSEVDKEGEGNRKVLVRWNVKPSRFMKKLNSLELRDVSTQLSTRPRPIVRGVSRSTSRPLSSPDRSPSPPDEAVAIEFNDDDVLDLDDLLPDPVFDLDAHLPALPAEPPACEAFCDGELVLYCSSSHQQTVCAFVLGSGKCLDSGEEPWPFWLFISFLNFHKDRVIVKIYMLSIYFELYISF